MSGFRALSSSLQQATTGVFQFGSQRSLDTDDEATADAGGCSATAAAASAAAAVTAQWITPKKYSPTNQMKSRALGHLDPTLYLNEDAEEHYEQGPGHVGRLWFALKYTMDSEQLTLCVRKARNLRVRKESNTGQPADCCVRVSLENDERRMLTTSIKRKTNNPNFDEKFCFQVPASCLETQAIRMTVLHVDKQKRHRPIGHVNFALKELRAIDRECRVFRDLESEGGEVTENPEVKIGLTFHAQLERITVGLHECRNLPVRADEEPMDVYLRVSLHAGLQGKEVKCKRTEASCQGFNESLIFNKVADVNQALIKITMMQRSPGIGTLFDKPIGSVVLGSELFAKRRELEHWKEMSDSPEQTFSHWHSFGSAV